MPRSPSDLPSWLRRGGGRGAQSSRRASRRGSITAAGFALMLFGGGVLTGFLIAGRSLPAAPPPAPPVCPPPIAQAAPEAGGGAAAPHPSATPPTRRWKPARAALQPLPEREPMDEQSRVQALREFAEKRGPELRECLPDPERATPVKVGAAFEIGAGGAVELVQILGAEGSSKDVRGCYARRLKRWRFPKALLRGEEKLLVNFLL